MFRFIRKAVTDPDLFETSKPAGRAIVAEAAQYFSPFNHQDHVEFSRHGENQHGCLPRHSSHVRGVSVSERSA